MNDEPQWTKVVMGYENQALGSRTLTEHLNSVGKWRFIADGKICEVPVRFAEESFGLVICEAFIPPEYVGKHFKAAPEKIT